MRVSGASLAKATPSTSSTSFRRNSGSPRHKDGTHVRGILSSTVRPTGALPSRTFGFPTVALAGRRTPLVSSVADADTPCSTAPTVTSSFVFARRRFADDTCCATCSRRRPSEARFAAFRSGGRQLEHVGSFPFLVPEQRPATQAGQVEASNPPSACRQHFSKHSPPRWQPSLIHCFFVFKSIVEARHLSQGSSIDLAKNNPLPDAPL
mmetsp:Transcript_32678/g.104195  ORF Transcript_32678/g.104195 Transcript_32678/m.104195 type:complete len:208 (+) Transcript_32678:884-1507(+)